MEKVLVIETVMARIGVYSLVDPNFEGLIESIITEKSIADTVAVICLDWSKPWNFLEQLQRWIGVLQKRVNLLDSETTTASQMKLDHFIRNAKDTDFQQDSTASIADIPLPTGVLTKNLGIPLIIVCHGVNFFKIVGAYH
jgi:dynein light intermediate chain 1, cytosolic